MLADGFSCRTQIHELDSGGREAMHLAELLACAGQLARRVSRATCCFPARPLAGNGGQADGCGAGGHRITYARTAPMQATPSTINVT